MGRTTEGDSRRATGRVLRLGDTERDLLAVDLDGRTVLLRLRQPVLQPGSV